jgi:hypothetical protein
MKKKLPVVTFAAESVSVLNRDGETLGFIFMDDDEVGVLFEPQGINLTADELVTISAEMYKKEQAK